MGFLGGVFLFLFLDLVVGEDAGGEEEGCHRAWGIKGERARGQLGCHSVW